MSDSALPVVVRSLGVTDTERYLGQLCEKSFLSLWSYPGIFRYQGNKHGGDGKELCDLLVVFGDDIPIFSDKSCKFPVSGNPRLDWSRWFRKAVLQSAKQVWGAERWIREHPTGLFLDRKCREPFPLDLPPPDRIRFHRIVVAHNISEHCRRAFGGSGTLMFNSDIEGRMHYDPKSGPCDPFAVGWIDPKRPFVHVLDDHALEILMSSRDTISDFIEYLVAKEALVTRLRSNGVRFFVAGEEELLARYLSTIEDGRHSFAIPDGYNSIMIPEGDWADFEASAQRQAQQHADQISYSWDALIEKFNHNILGGTSLYVSHPRIADREKIVRFLAREPRIRRRMLAEGIHELLGKTRPNQQATRVIRPSRPGDPYYLFLLVPRVAGQSEEAYREVRRYLLEDSCLVAKYVYREAVDIVGLATETGIHITDRSEDAFYYDAREWTKETEDHARRLQEEFGLLTKLTQFEGRVLEYPPVTDSHRDSQSAELLRHKP